MDVEHFAIANWVVVVVVWPSSSSSWGDKGVFSSGVLYKDISVCLPGKLCTHNKMVKPKKNNENATAIKRCPGNPGWSHAGNSMRV